MTVNFLTLEDGVSYLTHEDGASKMIIGETIVKDVILKHNTIQAIESLDILKHPINTFTVI